MIIPKILSFCKRTVFVLAIALVGVSSFFSPSVYAECEKTEPINWWDIAVPGNFVPIVPTQCSGGEEKPVPLNLDELPTILLRAFGLIVSIIVYGLLPVIMVFGVWYAWGGVSSGQTESALKYIRNLTTILIAFLILYAAIFALFSALGADTTILTTDTQEFIE